MARPAEDRLASPSLSLCFLAAANCLPRHCPPEILAGLLLLARPHSQSYNFTPFLTFDMSRVNIIRAVFHKVAISP